MQKIATKDLRIAIHDFMESPPRDLRYRGIVIDHILKNYDQKDPESPILELLDDLVEMTAHNPIYKHISASALQFLLRKNQIERGNNDSEN